MAIIRWIVGGLILFFDRVFTPRGIKRDPALQAEIDKQTLSLALYQFPACPFCVKVRRAMKRSSLNIATHDAKRSETSKAELLEGGGKYKVPCLRITSEDGNTQWMYESSDIIQYLDTHFPIPTS